MLLSLVAAIVFTVSPSVESALVFLDDHTAPRNATVEAAGAKVVKVKARAGTLKIRGREGLSKVEVRGTARASDEDYLKDITLRAERSGDAVEIEVAIPERNFVGIGHFYRALDLDIAVPAGVRLEVEDTSGELDIRDVGALDLTDSSGGIELANIAGNLDVDDSSGEIEVDGVRGQVRVSDSSGGIAIRRVVGSVDIEQDSSGEIEVEDVTGSVRVGRDSSGSISVATVGGDFVVERDGSGGIEHRGVKGSVRLPSRKR